MGNSTDNQTTDFNLDASFINRCEGQVFHDGIDLDDADRLRLFRLAGHTGVSPNYRAAWPPYASMIEDARRRIAR